MKVLFYIHNLQIGGAEKIVTDSIIELKQRGIEVVLVLSNSTNSFLDKRVIGSHIKTYVIQRKTPNNLVCGIFIKYLNKFINYRKRINKIIALENPDLIHIHTLLDKIYGIDFPISRMVFTFHSDVRRSINTNTKKNAKCLKIMSAQGMHFFALSSKMKNDIQECLSTNLVSIVPNAINVERIRSKTYDKKQFLIDNKIPTDAFVVGHIGRFDKVKNHERLISIFKAINAKKPNSFLILIGGGSHERISRVEAMAKELGIYNHIRFLGTREDATSILNCFDCFLLPSFSESFSLALIEAQALNVRSISSDCVPEDVICNRNCFALPLSETNDKWALLALSDQTHERYKDIYEFDFSVVIPKMIKEYEKVCSK